MNKEPDVFTCVGLVFKHLFSTKFTAKGLKLSDLDLSWKSKSLRKYPHYRGRYLRCVIWFAPCGKHAICLLCYCRIHSHYFL